MRRVAVLRPVLFTLVFMAISVPAPAANCTLRNPDRQIYIIFPDATSYRSVVAEIDKEMLTAIEKMLGSPLSFGDLGKHTAYVVLQDGVPIGFVHARSELGKSGSVELVWALDLDLRIRDFQVQRSREKYLDVIKADSFRQHLIGCDLKGLQSLLTDDHTGVDIRALQVPSRAKSIAHIAVLCGAKCRVITELAFGKTVHNARLLGNVHRFFPGTAKVTKISDAFSDEVVSFVKQTTGAAPSQIDPGSLVVLRALDGSGTTMGLTVFSRWSAHRNRPEVWWSVGPEGRIRNVVVVGNVEERTAHAFKQFRGRDLEELQGSAGSSIRPSVQCASEVLAILAAHNIGP